MTTRAARRDLARDARNRALRTFAQGIALTLASALVVAIAGAVTTSQSYEEFWRVILGWSFFQSVMTATLSWLMRRYVDGADTPLAPPEQ